MNLEGQPHRFSTCDRHPDEQFTGFCASCLRERLSGLETAATGRKNSSTTTTTISSSTLKSIFRSSGGGGNNSRNKASSSSSFLPELRRSKSFSGGRGEGFSGVFEPQRKSCDVRVRNTLWSLFNLDDERKGEKNKEVCGEIEVETSNLGFSGVGVPVLESREEEEEKEEEIKDSENVSVHPNVNGVAERVEEIEKEQSEEQEVKTMKDHIDLDSQSKKPPGKDLKEIAGNFWSAASVFSKKLQKWRRKQKMKKRGGGSTTMQVEKPAGRPFRETQSEIADYGFGRRSCDTDPRFSLDAGRMSFDDPRYSWDEPRASWDGNLIGRMFPRLPPMVEDVPVPVRRSDTQILVEEPMDSINEESTPPGGSAQTRDYYSDSSSINRPRRSLDRSSSIKMTAPPAVVAEVDDTKVASYAKVSPATIDYFHETKLLVADRDLRDLRDSNSNSLRDDCSESFESAFRDAASVVSGGDRKGSKKSRRWTKAWKIWALIHRRSSSKDEDEERYCKGNVVERSFSESWPELRREVNGEAAGALNRKIFRSNSSVNSRNSFNTGNSFSNMRSSSETNGHGKKKREEFVLERNRSARYSPSSLDNGLLRFYLTPLRSSRRSWSGKSKPKNSHSIARSVLRLY